jgi:hypothetical protein
MKNLAKFSKNLPNLSKTIEVSVKSGKNRTSTLSLVIHRVRFEINLQKSKLALKGGGETQEPSTLMVPEFHPVFLFS